MIKVIAVCPLSWDGTSYYRAWGVFRDLSNRYPIKFERYVLQQGGWSWAEFGQHDVLFLQRPGRPEDIEVANHCKDIGLKIWIDYDDNFFVLPMENRMAESVDQKARERMTLLIRMADLITVSTEALRVQMQSLGARNVQLIPNALNTEYTPPAKKFNKKRPNIPPHNEKPIFLWRGSDTHVGDIFDHHLAMIDAINHRQDVNWVFMGYNPWMVTRATKGWTHQKGQDIFRYYKMLRALRPELMHVVLTPNEFNLNKSNIAWIEATSAGAVCVGPHGPEWQKPGVILYSSLEEYRDIMINYDFDGEAMWKQSYEYIMENLLLPKMNDLRFQSIEAIMESVKLPIPQSMIE